MKKRSPAQTDLEGTLATIGPVARSSVVDAVTDRLRNEILAGRLAAGSRLPAERELSVALGVNRLTLRAALARLEAMGLVSTRHGSGTEVVSWRERAGLEALTMVMSSLDRSEPAWLDLLTSLLEVRRVLVAEIVGLAAERRTEEDLKAMARIVAEQPKNVGDPLAFAQGDLAFQRAIVRAAGNVGFELILNTFARFPEDQRELLAELYDRHEQTMPFYQAVIELIRAGDAETARMTLSSAFRAMDEDWLTRHGYRERLRARGEAAARTTTPRERESSASATRTTNPSGPSASMAASSKAAGAERPARRKK